MKDLTKSANFWIAFEMTLRRAGFSLESIKRATFHETVKVLSGFYDDTIQQ